MSMVQTHFVGHVSYVPVAHVAPRLRFLPLCPFEQSVSGHSAGGMRVAERHRRLSIAFKVLAAPS